ncbi:MAG: ribonuclease D [Verrucomicrobia bacterium]|nr:ribonuclease D [Verrucomicrobiota bacterium]
MIATDAALTEWLPRLKASPWVALDTEADSLHSYPEKLCLVQISLPGEDRLVDPLAGLDLRPLWQALSGREILLHAGDYDLRLLHRGPGFVPTRVFDTMLAARLLGLKEFGLNPLVQRFLGVVLEKGPQRADWSRRPLTERMMTYARNDARYIEPLASRLRAELEAKGRLEWHAQMCEQLIRDACQPPATTTMTPGASSKPTGSAARAWPSCGNSGAGATARPSPRTGRLSSSLRMMPCSAWLSPWPTGEPPDAFIPRRYSPRRRERLKRAIEEARAVPESDWPTPRKVRGRRLTTAQKHQLERLRLWRDRAAARLDLDPTLIASRSMLVTLAAGGPGAETGLLPWQEALLRPG